MKLDLAGKQFGYLTAIRPAERTKHGKIKWLWKCKCGKDVLAVGSAVKCGNTKSCGCVRPLTAYKTHGLSRGGKRTPEYAAFHSIIMRCTNPNTDAYPNYGGRGITAYYLIASTRSLRRSTPSRLRTMEVKAIWPFLGT